MIEQVPVIQAVTNPLVACGESQGEAGILMPAQGASHRDQTVSYGVITANACRNREASHPIGQWHGPPKVRRIPETVGSFPVFVQRGAVAQIGDAGAAEDTGDARSGAL
jgi:hypothetical protein